MPVYDYKCAKCGAATEAYNTIDDRRSGAPQCCGEAMDLAVSAPYGYVAGRWEAYKCVATGETISSKRQRSEVLRRNGLVDADWSANTHRQRERERNAGLEKLAREYHANTPAGVEAFAPALPA